MSKYIKVCPHCSTVNEAATPKCSNCGRQIEFEIAFTAADVEQAYRLCPECDHRNPVFSRDEVLAECSGCGNTDIMSGRFIPKGSPVNRPPTKELDAPAVINLTLTEISRKNKVAVPPVGGTIGRSGDIAPEFFAKCSHVSGLHCLLYQEGGGWHVRDLASLNHTFLNGNKLAPGIGVKLHAKSILQIADIKFDVEIT